MDDESVVNKAKGGSLTARARLAGDFVLRPLGRWLHQLGVHPDAVTVCGLVLVVIAGIAIGAGQLPLGGLLLLVALPLDALDGAVARARGGHRPFGAVFDSVLDRYADGFIFVAFSYYFAVQDRFEMLLLSLAALLGSLVVSYVRARADGVGVQATIGLLTRLERTIIILVMLLAPVLLDVGLLVLAIGTNITAIQRLWYVYRTLKSRGE